MTTQAAATGVTEKTESLESKPRGSKLSKPHPNKYPMGFSFWETNEVGNAIEAAAKEAGGNTSNWLRQTIRMRLRHEAQIRQAQARQMLANQGGNDHGLS